MNTQSINPVASIYSTEEVALLIANNTVDLYFDDFGSERSAPVEPFYQIANVQKLTARSFCEAIGISSDHFHQAMVAEFKTADESLLLFVQQHLESGQNRKAQLIVEFMQGHLNQLSVIILGEDFLCEAHTNHPVYLVGVGTDGNLAGIKSQIVWT